MSHFYLNQREKSYIVYSENAKKIVTRNSLKAEKFEMKNSAWEDAPMYFPCETQNKSYLYYIGAPSIPYERALNHR